MLPIILIVLAIAIVGLISVSFIYRPILVAISNDFSHELFPDQEIDAVDVLHTNSQIFAAVLSAYGAMIIALVATAVNVFLAFFIYRNVSTQQGTIQRLSYLAQIEDQITQLFNEKLARKECYRKVEFYCFRNVLNEIPWDPFFENANLTNRHKYVDGDNFVLIRADGTRLSSRALHESLLWFRRVHRACEARVLRPADLGILWRYIVPYAQARRYAFFRNYFSPYDWSEMSFICEVAFRQYYGQAKELPRNLAQTLDEEFLEQLGLERSELRIVV